MCGKASACGCRAAAPAGLGLAAAAVAAAAAVGAVMAFIEAHALLILAGAAITAAGTAAVVRLLARHMVTITPARPVSRVRASARAPRMLPAAPPRAMEATRQPVTIARGRVLTGTRPR